MSMSAEEAAPTEPKLRALVAALRNADEDTRDSVQEYLDAKSGRTGSEVIVLADIPYDLGGQGFVLAAPAAGPGARNFTVTPSSAEGASMVVDLSSTPLEPLAVCYSRTPASRTMAYYRVDESGAGSVATTPQVELKQMLAAIFPGMAEPTVRGPHEEAGAVPSNVEEIDHAEVLRARIAQTRQAVFEAGCSTNDAVAALNLTTGEAVRQRVARKELLGIKINRDYRFPRWQFDPSASNGILNGVGEVLSASPLSLFELVVWFETPTDVLGGYTPIDALRKGQISSVVAAARAAGSA